MYASVHIQATSPCCFQRAQNFKGPSFGYSSTFANQSNFTDKSVFPVNSLNARHAVHIEHISATPQLIRRSNHLKTICKATDAVQNKVKFTREELTAQQLEKWTEASKSLGSLGFEAEEIDKILGKAFGWIHSPYWYEEMPQTVPEAEAVSAAMDLARGTGLTDDQLVAVLKKFPELLNCLDTIETNMGILEKEWGIKGITLKNLIIRNPRVLGCNVDCKGDCMAKCTRCWARF